MLYGYFSTLSLSPQETNNYISLNFCPQQEQAQIAFKLVVLKFVPAFCDGCEE